ncbi:hypothetical protein JOC94_001798 [Bacillus thermophilus]|uniref:Uncharacterized protein n=1 Tax=Siminovitchia thermophila TaxID=1245522 RepID=A0ABS2R8B4_9BACI|nr:hypothetical protein [Siminovitchia thermophila]MBM7714826.1 hypothetical protein [Siminovitchia thermophila]
MKNRYLLCLLLCCALIYIALPRLNVHAQGLEGIFSLSWIAFALLVFAGNLAALLFFNKKSLKKHQVKTMHKDTEGRRIRPKGTT